MSTQVERGYRRFLLWTAGSTYGATVIELVLVEHYADAWQIAPFVLAVLGLGTAVWMAKTSRRAALQAVRWIGALVIVGSVVGVWLHVKGNAEFARDIDPSLSWVQTLWEGVSGVSPFLAPGMLGLAAILAIAATWRHPAWAESA